jgi:hypothetical protein
MWWLNELKTHTEAGLISANVVAMLVGNKSSLECLRAMLVDKAKPLRVSTPVRPFVHTGHPTNPCPPLHILRDAGRAMRKTT